MAGTLDKSWIWHPLFHENRADTSGLFVNFRRRFTLPAPTLDAVSIHITADTRYKLYVNGQQVAFGPIKGDQSLWFFDEVDIGPFLREGENTVFVRVLRFFHATNYAPSFPRLAFGGLRIVTVEDEPFWKAMLEGSINWEASIDEASILRVDEPEDVFLHIYERSTFRKGMRLAWVPAKSLEFKNSTGNAPPWTLSPRLLPPFTIQKDKITAVRNVQSTVPLHIWEAVLKDSQFESRKANVVTLSAGSRHRIDLEVSKHTTAFIRFCFRRPTSGGGTLQVTYSEGYEEEPIETPFIRRKSNRCDYSKGLYGPSDIYEFKGLDCDFEEPRHDTGNACQEVFAPFHWRTFRFLRLNIQVGSSDLEFEQVDITKVNYPLEVQAEFDFSSSADKGSTWKRLWNTSIHTLRNCMHDCYEDCPFYEQLQYAMDTRNSALFTYLSSGDDRLARQAIIQIHNSFQARLGLTASRAPTHRQQYIPNFSLYWICLVCDHFDYFADQPFVTAFLPVIDAILAYFGSRTNRLGLVVSELRPGIWNYVDWTAEWKPDGIPPSTQKTGISTFSNQLYAYTLKLAGKLIAALGRIAVAEEYNYRAICITSALSKHCYDGEFFTDTIVSASTSSDRSQHCQVWAVLSGAATGKSAESLLKRSVQSAKEGKIVYESISMSFYTLRALSLVGGTLYEDLFHQFWAPWQKQLNQNVTTWVEDDVSQRSDCHAWGSVPISELIVEVLGIRPAKPGFAALQFNPRTALFPIIQAKVPLMIKGGSRKGTLRISWKTNEPGVVEGEVEFEGIGELIIFMPAFNEYKTLSKSQPRFVFCMKRNTEGK